MRLGKFLFILSGVMIYGLLFSEQRMEYREKTATVQELKRELEELNARKQELTTLVARERERLVNQARGMGKPLLPKDIIVIE